MKKHLLILSAFSLLFILSCSSNDVETSNLRINHHQQPTDGFYRHLAFLVQEKQEIGTSTWKYFHEVIEGFEYESGYIYDLQVYKVKIEHPLEDASNVRYVLKNLVRKSKVSGETSFTIALKGEPQIDLPGFVTGNRETGFRILDKINIDCNILCEELGEVLENQDEVKGVFTHLEANTYKLIDLISN